MCEIKYFINRREPEAQDLADQMRQAGIDFSSVSTSGPLTLRIDGRPSYGPTAVKYAVQKLVEISRTQSQTNLLNASIIDLGGIGKLLLEIEYNNDKGEFKEAVYRLPESCNKQDIVTATIVHLKTHSVIILHFNQHDAFHIPLPDCCSELVEVRLPETIGGDNITSLFD